MADANKPVLPSRDFMERTAVVVRDFERSRGSGTPMRRRHKAPPTSGGGGMDWDIVTFGMAQTDIDSDANEATINGGRVIVDGLDTPISVPYRTVSLVGTDCYICLRYDRLTQTAVIPEEAETEYKVPNMDYYWKTLLRLRKSNGRWRITERCWLGGDIHISAEFGHA